VRLKSEPIPVGKSLEFSLRRGNPCAQCPLHLYRNLWPYAHLTVGESDFKVKENLNQIQIILFGNFRKNKLMGGDVRVLSIINTPFARKVYLRKVKKKGVCLTASDKI
jgi:hypothetical protein